MSYIDAIIVAPDGREYAAEVDEHADKHTLLWTLVDMLRLPLQTRNGNSIEYSLHLIGSKGLEKGTLVEIVAIEQSKLTPILSIKPRHL